MVQTRSYQAVAGVPLAEPGAFIDVISEVPEPGPREIRVQVEAVSVNPADTKTRASLTSGSRQLGWDASGVVEAVGSDVRRFTIGDQVWYAGDITKPGTNADLHLVDERIVGHKPKTLDHAAAAALPLTTITAWETLFDRFSLTEHSTGTLLVVGAPGGVGSILVQLAKQLTGLTVIGTAGRHESQEWVTSLGADHIVDHHHLVEDVTQVAPAGVDFVFSAHSARNIEAYSEIVRPFGAIAAIDEPPGLDLLPLKSKSIAWHWELMFTRPMFETLDMDEQGKLLDRVAGLVDDGTLRSTLTTRIDGLSAQSIRQAHQIVASGNAVGKVVVAR
jgi:zinc-binding alcohol dehydrogenase family protein